MAEVLFDSPPYHARLVHTPRGTGIVLDPLDTTDKRCWAKSEFYGAWIEYPEGGQFPIDSDMWIMEEMP
jgi:hypothetical protein